MIWTLRVECVGGMYWEEECVRAIEIDSESSLFELGDAILDAIGFDREHLFEFFAGRNPRHRKVVYEEDSDWERSGEIVTATDFEGHIEFLTDDSRENSRNVDQDDSDSEDVEDTEEGDTLAQVYPLPKSCKLYYYYDFGDSWFFEIRKSRKKPTEPEEGVEYPRVVEEIGPSPQQYGSWGEE